MGKKNSFVIYDNWSTLLCELPDDQAGKLIKIICSYKLGTLETIDDPVLEAIFKMVKNKMDEDAEAYEDTCKVRSEAAKKGNEKRWADSKKTQKVANAIDESQKVANETECITNVADNDTDTDTDNDNVTDTGNETEKINYQLIADMYNNTCVSFPKLTRLSDKRKRAIKARLKKYSVDDIKRAFELAEQSDFLKGGNSRDWSANFDWLMKDSNLAKVLDGNYKNRSPSGKLDIDSEFRAKMRSKSDVIDFGM